MGWRKMLAMLVLSGAPMFPLDVQAQSIDCNFEGPDPVLQFGTVPANPTPAQQTTGSVGVRCSGYAPFFNPGPIKACLKLSNGAPDSSLLPDRRMANAGARMRYQVYTDAARSQVWGDATGAPAREVLIPLQAVGWSWSGILYEGSATVSMYGQIRPGQAGLTSGTYRSDMALRLTASYNPGDSCGSLNAPIDNDLPVSASAGIASSCTIEASDLSFGIRSRLDTAPVNASTSLGVNCTLGTPYTVRLDGGTVSGNVADRRMALNGAGTGVIAYQLRHTSPNGPLWGDGTRGTGVVAGTGTGSSQTLPVYGRVPVQPTPPVGYYEDTVTATVVY